MRKWEEFILFFKMSNKKGAEKYLSIYWFMILIIVAVGIYGMVSLYYNHPYDIRELEANILVNKVADCISYEGELRPEVFNESNGKLSKEFENDFLNTCNITFNVEEEYDWGKREQYYLEVGFYDISLVSLGSISKGEKTWKENCLLKGEEEYEIFSKCVNKRFYSLYRNKPLLIEVFVGIRKTEKNVK